MIILHLTVGQTLSFAAGFGAFQHRDAKGKCEGASVFGNVVSKGAL